MRSLTILLMLPFIVACLQKQTNQSQFDEAMRQHLPALTTVVLMTEYDIQKKYGRNTRGVTECPSWRYRMHCTIYTINDPEVLLHEFCHVIEGKWHGNTPTHGLSNFDGCVSFNKNTVVSL